MIGAMQRDHAFFSSIGVNYQAVKTRRHHFISFGKEKNRGCATAPRICNAVEISRHLQCDRTCQEPKVPPAKLTQDHFAQWRWIMQNDPSHFTRPRCGKMKRSRNAGARSERHDWPIVYMTF